MVPLLSIGDAILVFDLGHVRVLRQHGIVGVLIGSLPKAPQQNVFLGLPLQLSIYEAIWSVHAGIAVVVDGLRYSDFLAEKSPSGSPVVSLSNNVQYAITLDTHTGFDGDLASVTIDPRTLISRYCDSKSETSEARDFWPHYAAFKHLRELQYYMMPGLRFGGAFVAYPGDPLKFHSHLIVKVLRAGEKVDLLKLVTSGRLATAVKKAWLLIGEKAEDRDNRDIGAAPEMQAFSIEWAGFG